METHPTYFASGRTQFWLEAFNGGKTGALLQAFKKITFCIIKLFMFIVVSLDNVYEQREESKDLL